MRWGVIWLQERKTTMCVRWGQAFLRMKTRWGCGIEKRNVWRDSLDLAIAEVVLSTSREVDPNRSWKFCNFSLERRHNILIHMQEFMNLKNCFGMLLLICKNSANSTLSKSPISTLKQRNILSSLWIYLILFLTEIQRW